MATYKGIQGYSVQSLGSDVTPAVNYTGQLFYNSASNVWKLSAAGNGAFSAANSTLTPRSSAVGYGVLTAALLVSGAPPPGTYTTDTEEYNGTCWSAGGSVTTLGGQECFGTGTQTAGLWMGGYDTTPGGHIKTSSEEYDGTSWTAGGTLTTKRRGGASAGTQTAAILYAGTNGFVPGGPGSVRTANCQEYNGTAWTNSSDIDVTMVVPAGSKFGTQTAAYRVTGALYGHGAPAAPSNTTATYDGTSWTAGTSVNTGRPVAGGFGTTALGIIFGGEPITAICEVWDGSTWTESSNLATPRSYSIGAGTNNTAGIAFCGRTGPTTYTGATEEWTAPNYEIQTVTTS